jgi:hypothetical protein
MLIGGIIRTVKETAVILEQFLLYRILNKIKNGENKIELFPHFQKVLPQVCSIYKSKVSVKLGFSENESDSIKILKFLREKSVPLYNINAELDSFNFKLLISELKISEPKFININWNNFEDIDKFKLIDFSNNLKYIWYAGPDDIEVFPDDLSWVISIDAIGDIYLYR